MKQWEHLLMGLYFWTLSFQPHSKGLIFLNKYILFHVPIVNVVWVTNFEDGIQKNHCWTLSGQRLVFFQIWYRFSETMPIRFFNCCDFISSVDVCLLGMAATFLILFLPFNSLQFGASFAQDSAILQILFPLLDLSNLEIGPP